VVENYKVGQTADSPLSESPHLSRVRIVPIELFQDVSHGDVADANLKSSHDRRIRSRNAFTKPNEFSDELAGSTPISRRNLSFHVLLESFGKENVQRCIAIPSNIL